MRAWIAVASGRTRIKREELAGQISAIPDEQLRANLRRTMVELFRSLDLYLERASAGRTSPCNAGADRLPEADVTLPSHHRGAPVLLTAQLRISRSGQPRPTDARQRRTRSVFYVGPRCCAHIADAEIKPAALARRLFWALAGAAGC
jgi:hypothetical protein